MRHNSQHSGVYHEDTDTSNARHTAASICNDPIPSVTRS